MPAANAEPQLTLRGAGGARRWGPAHFEAAPAASAAAAAVARAPATGRPYSQCPQRFRNVLASSDRDALVLVDQSGSLEMQLSTAD